MTETPDTPTHDPVGDEPMIDHPPVGKPAVRHDLLLIGASLVVAVAGYFLVKKIPAASSVMVDKPALGVVAYAIGCIVVLALILRNGSQQLAVVRNMGAAGPLALFSAAMPAIGGFLLIGSLEIVGPALRDMGAAGPLVYAVAFMILAGCALLPTYAQAILGGWAFQFAVGFPAALVGITGASLIGYLLGAGASGPHVLNLIKSNPKWEAVRVALADGGFFKTLGLVILIRLPPNSPFALTNLVMSSVRISLPAYALGTIIGIAPRTGVAVFLAAQIQNLLEDGLPEKPPWLIFGGIGVSVVAFLLLWTIGNKAVERATQG